MPTSVTASNGNTYHLFQLSTANSVKQFEESIGFTRLLNALSVGYRSRRLLGSSTGLRKWNLTLPTLAHSTVPMPMVTGVNGETVSREKYLWDLYCECEITGTPFVIQSEHDSQYFLCEFVDERLTYQGMKFKLYSTGVELVQVRLDGVTVYDPANMSGLVVWNDETTHSGANWNNKVAGTGSYGDWTGAGDVLSPSVSGKTVKRLNSVTNTGVLTTELVPTTTLINDAVIVFKVREATFGQTSGILSTTFDQGSGGNQFLLGVNGTNDVADSIGGTSGNGFGNKYLNGSTTPANTGIYAVENLPMNALNVLYMKGGNPTIDPSVNLAGFVQMGRKFADNTTKAEIDIHEMMFFSVRKTEAQIAELGEYLLLKWS